MEPAREPGGRPPLLPVLVPAGLALLGLLLTLAVLAGPVLRRSAGAAAIDAGPGDVRSALARGNRLVRRGELEAAVDAYAAGWPGMAAAGRRDTAGAAAALAYNLGTAHHRGGRLPEALLWYRRAELLAPADPWLTDNLELVRAELAAPRRGPPGPVGRLAAGGDPRLSGLPGPAALAAVALAWLALALAWLAPRLERRARSRGGELAARHAWTVPALLALLAWGAGTALAAWGPQPAVLLDRCGGELPAGSEVWVTPAREAGGWRLSGGPPDLVCPTPAVAPVVPD